MPFRLTRRIARDVKLAKFFGEFTTALNPLESLFPRLPFIMTEISSALQVMLYPANKLDSKSLNVLGQIVWQREA